MHTNNIYHYKNEHYMHTHNIYHYKNEHYMHTHRACRMKTKTNHSPHRSWTMLAHVARAHIFPTVQHSRPKTTVKTTIASSLLTAVAAQVGGAAVDLITALDIGGVSDGCVVGRAGDVRAEGLAALLNGALVAVARGFPGLGDGSSRGRAADGVAQQGCPPIPVCPTCRSRSGRQGRLETPKWEEQNGGLYIAGGWLINFFFVAGSFCGREYDCRLRLDRRRCYSRSSLLVSQGGHWFSASCARHHGTPTTTNTPKMRAFHVCM